MNFLDGLILIPIAYGLYAGFKRGLVKEVLGLAGFVAGMALALTYHGHLTPWLAAKLGWSEDVTSWFSGIVIMLGTLSAAHLAAALIGRLVGLVLLGTVNRIFGALFSGVKWGLAVSIVMLAVSALGFRPGPELREGSLAYRHVERAAPWVFHGIARISPSAAEALARFRQGMEESIDSAFPPVPQNGTPSESPDRRHSGDDRMKI